MSLSYTASSAHQSLCPRRFHEFSLQKQTFCYDPFSKKGIRQAEHLPQTQEGSKLNISLVGRLDTVTSPQLQEVLDSSLNGITELAFDFAKLDYISSAGLRVLLATNKKMAKAGKMVIRNVNDVVQEVFDMTGFADILNIE